MDFSSSCSLRFPERLVQLLKNFKFLTSLNSVAYKLLLIKDTKCTRKEPYIEEASFLAPFCNRSLFLSPVLHETLQ